MKQVNRELMLKKYSLSNGLRVVCENIPHVRSISIGIWVGTGSRNEENFNNGISHFIEHMLFKGTKYRSAKQIAESIDNIGGQINAFTGKECTCYYTKTLDEHINIAVDVLSDMLFNSILSQKDIEVERKVIIEEIGMYEDSPEDLVHDLLSETVWKGNPLGLPILGTENSLENIDKKAIKDYMRKRYSPSECVISVAGNFDDLALKELLEEKFSGWASNSEIENEYDCPEFKNDYVFKEKDIEQVHVCFGFKGVEHGHDDLYSLLAINNILGGGMSSRLFQKIREELGLVYSVYSYPSSYKNSGLYTIYAGMNPVHLEKVGHLVIEEVQNLARMGISDYELEKSKEQLKGNYILGLESTNSRMNSIGKSELLLGKIFTPDQVLAKIEKINMETIQDVICKVFDPKSMSFSSVGNANKGIDIKQMVNNWIK